MLLIYHTPENFDRGLTTQMKSSLFEQQYYKIRNPKSKSKKVIATHIKEIIDTVSDYTTKQLREMDVLDVGSGQGNYCFELEGQVKSVVGCEPYDPAYKVALLEKKSLNSKVSFYNTAIEELKIRKKFDLILCLTVIEHMPNAKKSFRQIFQLLKQNGIIYLTAPNKLWPMESHYKLPFLSWLSLPLANFYVRMLGRAQFYEDSSYSKTYFGMKAFFDQFPYLYEFILPKNIDGDFMGCGSGNKFYKIMMRTGIFLISHFPIFWILAKGFIIIIKKNGRQFRIL